MKRVARRTGSGKPPNSILLNLKVSFFRQVCHYSPEIKIIGPALAVPDYPPGYVNGLLARLLAKKATRGQKGGAP